jgi:hypothetical protein
MSKDEVRHAHNSAVPGRTICGLTQFGPGVKFAFARKRVTCSECLRIIARLAKTRPQHALAIHRAKRKQQLESVPSRRFATSEES